APRIPIWTGVAARMSTAVRGSAIPVMPLPKCETVCPSQSFTKSEFFHRPVRYCGIHLFHMLLVYSLQKTEMMVENNYASTLPYFNARWKFLARGFHQLSSAEWERSIMGLDSTSAHTFVYGNPCLSSC